MRQNIALLIFFATGLFSCSSGASNEQVNESKDVSAEMPLMTDSATYTIEIIKGSEGTFGYDIKKDGKTFIHQPHLPGRAGNSGFNKEEQAQKAAELMIDKLKKNIVPPTISEEELNDVLNN